MKSVVLPRSMISSLMFLYVQVVQKASSALAAGALYLQQKVSQTFLPTAVKFHYVFNLRDLSNIFQVLLLITGLLFQSHSSSGPVPKPHCSIMCFTLAH